MTKTILVVGDSLTWGADPATKRRHPRAFQWPHVMQTGLGEGAEVVTEALCGRTTSFDDHAVLEERNAARSLPMLLSSHQPLSLVIIMLGTNDLKPHLCGLARGAQAGLKRLVQLVRTHPYIDGAVPKILIVAPPPRIPTPAPPRGQRRDAQPVAAPGAALPFGGRNRGRLVLRCRNIVHPVDGRRSAPRQGADASSGPNPFRAPT